MSIFGRARTRAVGLTVLAIAFLLVAVPAPANAATSFTATNLTAAVSGTSVTATVTIKASAATTAQVAGICVRDSQNRDRDFPPGSTIVISVAGINITKTATFTAGTYQYFACVYAGGVWTNVGTTKTFTVGGSSSTPPAATPPSSTSPSGVAMPVGDLPGWKQAFTEDFKTTVARGGFPGPYAANWLSYDGFTDTSGVGFYEQDIISAQNGNLDLYLHTENGRPLGAAPIPLVNGKWGGQIYGRFSVRMRADSLPGYGTGFLLWTDSGNWADGEIDFPESGLSDVVKGYNHCPGNPSRNCLVVNSNTTYTGWHTYTIEWRPERLSFLIDGSVVGSTTSNIPNKSLHWVMQVATTGVKPAATTAGHLLIDWVTIHRLV